jgi:hypothetical protein
MSFMERKLQIYRPLEEPTTPLTLASEALSRHIHSRIRGMIAAMRGKKFVDVSPLHIAAEEDEPLPKNEQQSA